MQSQDERTWRWRFISMKSKLKISPYELYSSLATLLDVVYELHTHQRHGRLHSPSCTALNPCVSVGHLFRPSEEINSSTAKRYDHSYL